MTKVAVPVLASSGSIALAGLLGEPWGFDRSPKRAPLFWATVAIMTVAGAAAVYIAIAHPR
jgi:hypothetical protein